MPVQFPTLSIETQSERVKDLSENTLFPYSYSCQFDGSNAAQFPSSDGNTLINGTFKYTTIRFLADNTMGIYAIQWQLSGLVVFPASGVPGYTPEVVIAGDISYSPTFTISPNGAGPFATPTVPGDTGNQIYRYVNFISVPQPSNTTGFYTRINDNFYERYTPNNYLLKYNQYLYIHFGVDAIIANAFYYLTVVLHMRPTGQKT